MELHEITPLDGELVQSQEEDIYQSSLNLLMANQEWRLATSLAIRLHGENAQSESSLKNLARCLSQVGERANASVAYSQLCKKFPGFENYVESGNFYYEIRNYIEAKRFYTKAICDQKEDYVLLFDLFKNLGNIACHEGDFEQAEDFYNKAHRIYSKSAMLATNYGSLYFLQSKFSEAKKSFQQAIDLNAETEKAYIGLAMVNRQSGDGDMAIANIKKALDINPMQENAIKMLANWALKDFSYSYAIEAIENFNEQSEYNEDINVLLAGLYYQAGFRDESKFETNKILAFNPQNADAIKLLGVMEDYE
ncbi:MAG: tetratricopeptide repeat protein [Bdellovibrionales bacterium]